MTLQELQAELHRCESLAACDAFLQVQLHDIRPLFYGLTRQELQENHRYLDYEDVFLSFTNSRLGQAIRAGEQIPASIVALLIFFLSLFERAKLYTAIQAVAELIPPGTLRNRGEALFEYKHIQNANVDYIERFDRILQLLQESWNNSATDERIQCEDLLREYILDAMIEPLDAQIDILQAIIALFRDQVKQHRFPILANPSIQNILNLRGDSLVRERIAVRSRIVESLHAEACSLVPDALLTKLADEMIGEAVSGDHAHTQLPAFLDDQLARMKAMHMPQREAARCNFDATPERNRIYLGTFFPRSVIESWNILSEVLSIPLIDRAFAGKDPIRILDVGSGTGAAVVGTLLALTDWGRCEVRVEVTSMDINEDALVKQGEILASLREHLPFDLEVDLRHVSLPFDLDGFVPAFSAIAEQEGHKYDIITFWKCLCEFYNVNYAPAQGIIRNTLRVASSMLVPYGLCILSDVTTTDNKYEYFAMTMNREANENDSSQDTITRTILPLPCARTAATCKACACYTQRRFKVSHRLAQQDSTKIAYRVFAPIPLASSVTATFTRRAAYRVNAARPAEACFDGQKREVDGNHPCGYTGFFADGD